MLTLNTICSTTFINWDEGVPPGLTDVSIGNCPVGTSYLSYLEGLFDNDNSSTITSLEIRCSDKTTLTDISGL